jgi:hypothetical protein
MRRLILCHLNLARFMLMANFTSTMYRVYANICDDNDEEDLPSASLHLCVRFDNALEPSKPQCTSTTTNAPYTSDWMLVNK